MREKIQKLIDEGNAVKSTGLPYNMWLNHIEKFYRSENFLANAKNRSQEYILNLNLSF